ncbi:hypothetical protein ACIGFK_14060 [Streptomyces sp. NPDC085524]|uniref:hypothetical protein n=1 Tax=Streptomyces sp. NPDC085524 TaxID=3365728 RepID=UPI0037D90A12
MAAVMAVLAGALILAGVVHDAARLIAPTERRVPPLARLRGRRAALEAAERWCVGLRLHGRIDAATDRRRMALLARGRRTAPPGHRQQHVVVSACCGEQWTADAGQMPARDRRDLPQRPPGARACLALLVPSARALFHRTARPARPLAQGGTA